MRLTWRDGIATVLVGVAVAVYWVWMGGTEVFGLASNRAVAGVLLILGIAGCYTARSYFEAIYGAGGLNRPPMLYVVLVSATGIVALVAAMATLIGGSTITLTILIVAMIGLWAMATVRHLATHRPVTNREQHLAAIR